MDIFRIEELEAEMLKIADILWPRIELANVRSKTLTLKFKYSDFEQHTRSNTVTGWFYSKSKLIEESKKLLNKDEGFSRGIRLLGLTLSNFTREENSGKPVQLVIEF